MDSAVRSMHVASRGAKSLDKDRGGPAHVLGFVFVLSVTPLTGACGVRPRASAAGGGEGADAGTIDEGTAEAGTAADAASESNTHGGLDAHSGTDGEAGGVQVEAGGVEGDATGVGDGGSDIPGGGTILFQEKFDDTNFTARGWSSSRGTLSTAEHASGSASSFECDFAKGGGGCSGGSPSQHNFTLTDTVYVAFYLKYSANWIGSGLTYWPHMINMATNLDALTWNPSNSYLTTYEEIVWDAKTGTGTAQLALQDELNVDNNCVLLNDGTFNGCNGNPKTYVFTENRSVCACNGIVGDLDQRDCFSDPQSYPAQGQYYSSRAWTKAGALTDANKSNWHFIEVYFAMNSIQQGIGVPDGKIRWVQDGVTLISHDHILMRTGAHPTAQFMAFLFGMYIGSPGAPIAETFWLDDVTVATARP